jgi:hypothetical protein
MTRKSSRDRLSDDFVAALAADWREHGTAVLAEVRQKYPEKYARLIVDLVPKELRVLDDEPFPEFAGMSQEEMRDYLLGVIRELGVIDADAEFSTSKRERLECYASPLAVTDGKA